MPHEAKIQQLTLLFKSGENIFDIRSSTKRIYASCFILDDHLVPGCSALFMARSILSDIQI